LEYLAEYGCMYEEEAKNVIFNVIIGTSHMHSINIIHRDLKLENILIHKQNSKIDKVKIIDLGLGTKIFGETSGFFGTPNYMPPEVFQKSTYDYKFDVFSIGVILFTILASEFPFNDDSVKGLSLKIQFEEPD